MLEAKNTLRILEILKKLKIADSSKTIDEQISLGEDLLDLYRKEENAAKQRLDDAERMFKEARKHSKNAERQLKDNHLLKKAHKNLRKQRISVEKEVFDIIKKITIDKPTWDTASEAEYTMAINELGMRIVDHSNPHAGVATKDISRTVNRDGSITVKCVPLYGEPDDAFEITVDKSTVVKD